MMDYRSAPSPAVNPPHLRIIRDEEAPPYDGGEKRRAPFCMVPRALVVEHGATLGVIPIAVYAALSSFASGTGRCWPSLDRIAATLGLSRRSVIRAISTLEAAGWVIRERRTRGPNGRDSNVYVLPHASAKYVTEVHLPPEVSDSGAQGYVTQTTEVSDSGAQELDTRELESLRTRNVLPLISPAEHNGQSAEALPLPLSDDDAGLRTDDPSPPDSGDPPAPTPKKARPPDPPGFVEFWAAYPKGHGSRKAAADWWRQHKPDEAAVAEIMAGLADWHQSRRWREGYVKDAERWLRGRLWENPPPAGAANNGAIPETSDDGGLAAWRASGVRS